MPARCSILAWLSWLVIACGPAPATDPDAGSNESDGAQPAPDGAIDADGGGEPDGGPPSCGASICPSEAFGSSVTYHGVWGADDDAIWVVGDGATIRFFDGTRWTLQPAGTDHWGLTAVHGTARDDVWAVGYGGTVLHFDGSAWTSLDTGTTAELRGVVALARDDVWIVGRSQFGGALALHWDGTSFREDSPSPGHALRDVAGSEGRIVAFDDEQIFEWDGAWRTLERAQGIQDVAVVGADTLALSTFVPLAGYAVIRVGTSTRLFTGDPALIGQPFGLDVRALDRIAVVGPGGRIEELDGTTERRRARTPHQLHDVWIAPDGSLWAVGEHGTVVHAIPDRVRTVDAGDLHSLLAVHARARDDVWAVGPAGRVVRFDGARWARLESRVDVDLRSVSAASDGSTWAVGEAGVALRFSGASTERHDLPVAADLHAIVADAGGAMWAAGTVLHRWNGSSWAEVAPLAHRANDAYSPASGEIWLAQEEGHVVRYVDGVLDASVDPDTAEDATAIGGADGRIWVGLADGSIMQWTSAGGWTGLDAPPGGFVGAPRAIFATSASDVLAVGSQIARYDGTAWTLLRSSPLTDRFEGAHGVGPERWVVGWRDGLLYGSR